LLCTSFGEEASSILWLFNGLGSCKSSCLGVLRALPFSIVFIALAAGAVYFCCCITITLLLLLLSCVQVDLAPLPKVLREHVREQQALQQQQLDKLAAMDTEEDETAAAAAAAAANGSGGAAAVNGVAAAAAADGGDQGAAAAAAAKPVPVPDVLTDAEQENWVKTDNIIMGVLRRYLQAYLRTNCCK
jgi:hypothetical protein